MPETILNAKQLNMVQLTQVLENPQSMEAAPLKLSVDNNVLTLKAGSKITIPAGVSNNEKQFNIITTSSDLTITTVSGYGNDMFVFYSNGELFCYNHASSDTSTTYSNAVKYNPTTNLITHKENNTVLHENVSFPLCIIKVYKDSGESNYTPKAIIKRFDYIGYHGAWVFVNPGYKISIPNGFNTDGSERNIIYTTETVLVKEAQQGNCDFQMAISRENDTTDIILYNIHIAPYTFSAFRKLGNYIYDTYYSKVVKACPVATFYTNFRSDNMYIQHFHTYNPMTCELATKHITFRYVVTNPEGTSSVSVGLLIKDKQGDEDFAVYVNGQRVWCGDSTYGTPENDYYIEDNSYNLVFNNVLPMDTKVTVEVF